MDEISLMNNPECNVGCTVKHCEAGKRIHDHWGMDSNVSLMLRR